jgi:hypothetical protein
MTKLLLLLPLILAGCCKSESEAKPLRVDEIEKLCRSRGLDCDVDFRYSSSSKTNEMRITVWRGRGFAADIAATLSPKSAFQAAPMLTGIAIALSEKK